MKNFILILLMAVAVLFTAPDVGATANPPPVKRELKALTKAKPQKSTVLQTRIHSTQTLPQTSHEVNAQEVSEKIVGGTIAPYDPGWQLMRQ